MNLLYKYTNGNVIVSIFDDGTKIQEWNDNEKPNPIYPNSMDIKITNKCDLGCKFCHEMSIPNGKHGDLFKLLELIYDLPSGTELALGGGNPLDHPDLIWFVEELKKLNIIPNITINCKHIIKYMPTLNWLINNKYIYGLGISIDDSFNFKLLDSFNDTSNIVYHVIAGVHPISVLEQIKESPVKKVLILGYKDVGRGIDYHDDSVNRIKKEWYDLLPQYIGKVHLSFDNLAIEQLNIRRFFTDESWKNFYMGSDGQFTMYIDAVEENFAVSSTSKDKFPINGSISEIFSKVRSVKGF